MSLRNCSSRGVGISIGSVWTRGTIARVLTFFSFCSVRVFHARTLAGGHDAEGAGDPTSMPTTPQSTHKENLEPRDGVWVCDLSRNLQKRDPNTQSLQERKRTRRNLLAKLLV